MLRALFAAFFCASSLAVAPRAADAQTESPSEDLNVISGWPVHSDARHYLYHRYRLEAEAHLDARARKLQRLESAEQWRAYREHVRRELETVMGAFPERTPLNARVTGTVAGKGYRIEKLVYESVPGFYVTAALYLPDTSRSTPAPAILFASGHAAEGFRSPTYQTMILDLVHQGFVVLAFDPVGQGERIEYFDAVTGEPSLGPTRQHSYPGAQGFLLGGSPARRFIWDGIRGIDYLVSREEVDAARIGVTGRSGGGTQSSYIAAMDDRVAAAAPEAYITSFERLLATLGGQDVEQNWYHGIARGLDHGDLFLARAPKPTLLIATTRDFFSIQGARETVVQTRPAFASLGATDSLERIEDDDVHASTEANRRRMVEFFQRHLSLPGGPVDESLVDILELDELRVTASGQVQSSLGGETTFSLNRKRALELTDELEARRGSPDATREAVEAAKRLSGYDDAIPPDGVVFAGRYRRAGYSVEKYALESENGNRRSVLPLLLFVPAGAGPHPAVAYLHPEGKSVDAAPGGAIERLVRAGYVVAAPDLAGVGELSPGHYGGDAVVDGVSFNLWFLSILVGRSLVATQAQDLVRIATFLRAREDVASEPLTFVARDELAPTLLHAASFDHSIGRIALVRPLVSYASLATTRMFEPRHVPSSVAAALTEYDLVDLAASLAPRELWIAGMTDAAGAALSREDYEREWASAIARYADEAPERLRVTSDGGVEDVLEWLERRASR